MIQTDNQTDTRILRFTVLDANAKEAKKIANELADVTAERVAYVMSSDKPKVVEEAVVPKYPSSPNTKKNTAMGGLAFAFVAAAVIVLRYLMNDTIQTEEDIKKYLGLHMLAGDSDRKEGIDLKDRTRKIIVAVLLVIAVCCAGYLIWYYATAAKTKQSYDDAKSWQRKM